LAVWGSSSLVLLIAVACLERGVIARAASIV
jgi:hypothetical protein